MPGTNVVGASGAINGIEMLKCDRRDGWTDTWTDRREGGNSILDFKLKCFNLNCSRPNAIDLLDRFKVPISKNILSILFFSLMVATFKKADS